MSSSQAEAAAAAAAASMEEVGVVDVPSGYRFIPTDLELIRDYLCKKITNQKLPSDVPVVDYDIYATEPWNLPVNNKIDTISSNRSYYFVKLFDGIDRRQRLQRVVNPSCDGHGVIVAGGGGKRRGGGGGCWKRIAGGRDTRYIRDERYRPIGVKKSFAFHAYVCSPPHSNNNTTTVSDDDAHNNNNNGNTTTTTTTTWKTKWIMDEYSINSQQTQPWVLCILRKGGVEEEDEVDEVQLLSLIQLVQQPEEKVHQPDHDLPYKELEMLEKIKTIQEKVMVNQIQIWGDQYELRKLNELRVYYRRVKQRDNIIARHERFKEKWLQYTEGKITMADLDELEKHQKEEIGREHVALKAEAATIRAGSYYQVQQPSRFRKRKKMQILP